MVWGYFAAALAAVSAPQGVAAEGCTISSYSALSKVSGCSSINISGLTVPAGGSIDLNLKSGATVTFSGKTSFTPSSGGRSKPLISITGNNVRIIGAAGNTIHGNGQAYWDGSGGNGGRAKPKFFRLKLTNSRISNLHIVNTPVHCFSISGCKSLTLDGIRIDNSAGDRGKGRGGHNTDAFDVGDSHDITISNAWVHNQDDCLAVNSGTNIKFLNGTCIGGHGLSIGSVGGRSNNVVRGVHIANSRISNSENGVRIKTKANKGKGSVSDVTYSGITLSGITKRGIVIQQDYENSGPTGRPGADVKISGLKLSNIHGSVSSGAKRIFVLCASGGCSNWTWSGISISGGSVSCKGAPSGASSFCR